MKKFYLILIGTGVVAFLLMIGVTFFIPPLPPDFKLPPKFIPPQSGPIRPFPIVNFTEFEHFNLRNFFGYPLGNLYGLIIIRFVLTNIWFVLAVYFLLRYTKGFYGPRGIPLSWLFLISGMIITNIAEIGENFVFHEWPYLAILEHNFLFIVPHLWGGFLIAIGAYFLLGESKS